MECRPWISVQDSCSDERMIESENQDFILLSAILKMLTNQPHADDSLLRS
jgi:hypothetical protein